MNWDWITNWKLRLTVGGCVLSVLSIVLMAVRGFKAIFAGLLVVGIIILIVGLLWRSAEERKRPQ